MKPKVTVIIEVIGKRIVCEFDSADVTIERRMDWFNETTIRVDGFSREIVSAIVPSDCATSGTETSEDKT